MTSLIASYLGFLGPLGYILLFLGMIFEGDAVLFLAGFLTHQGFFEPIPMAATVLWGVIVGDNLWYSLGLKFKKSSFFLNRWARRITAPFDGHLLNKPMRTIFISKFTYGLNHAILVRAGELGIKWKHLEKGDILATLLWAAIVGGLGYFSSASFSLVKSYLRFTEIALLLGFLIFFGLEYLITEKTKKRL